MCSACAGDYENPDMTTEELERGTEDALDALLAQYGDPAPDRRKGPRPILHYHVCAECGNDRTCLQEPCAARFREGKALTWACAKCRGDWT